MMKYRRRDVLYLLLAILVIAATSSGSFGIYKGLLQTNLNGNGFSATNFGSVFAGGVVGATNGFLIESNAVSVWPPNPAYAGQAYLGNSNGVVYLLTSSFATTWQATNKLAP